MLLSSENHSIQIVNLTVVTNKSTRKVEPKGESRNRRVVSQSDQNGIHKEVSSPPVLSPVIGIKMLSRHAQADSSREKKKEIKKKSLKTSVSVNRSAQKEPTPPPEARDVTPARYPVSKIVHVRNLVRPFTLPQLKNFLGKLGKVEDNSFWIDKIKSHCLVTVSLVPRRFVLKSGVVCVATPIKVEEMTNG